MLREFRKNLKQIEAIDLIADHEEALLEGGSRSGKTFIEIYAMIVRGKKYPETNHLSVRKCFNHAKFSLGIQTIPAVFSIAFPNLRYKTNLSDWYFEFEGSKLFLAGTDDKERIEKILGTEFATIHLNEVSEQSYDTYELFKTRLNPPKRYSGLKGKLLMDQNPPNRKHWSHKKFHQLIDPITLQPLSDKIKSKQCRLLMNPDCNVDNLSDGYIETLEGLSEAKQRRFLRGEYSDDTDRALWKRVWIQETRINEKPIDIIRIVVAIDPNVTEDKKANSTTDDAGIIVVCQYKVGNEFHYAVMGDHTAPGLSWGEEAVNAYQRFGADKIIAEVNQGGDLVKMNIRNYDRDIAEYHYDEVRATRGKEIRAEPVADLYRKGLVHHIGIFTELEDELCEWVPGEGRSPNRLDALVWGISYLAGIYIKPAEIVQITGW